MLKRLVFFCGTILLILAPTAQAAKFANQFAEFELPSQWQCNLEGAEWVCQSTDANKKRDAIIILAAKLKGDQDSLDQYIEYLKKPKTYTSLKGQPVKSEPKYAKTVQINEHAWVDSLHLESEVPGYYTRYLATIKQDIGVLVSYSINKGKYQDYLNDFENLVRSLKVFRNAGGLNTNATPGLLFDQTNVPQHLTQNSVFPGAGIPADQPTQRPQQQGGDDLMIYIGAGIALLAFIIWRRRRSGG